MAYKQTRRVQLQPHALSVWNLHSSPLSQPTWRKESPHGSDNGAVSFIAVRMRVHALGRWQRYCFYNFFLFKPTNLFKYNFAAYVSTELIRREYNSIFLNITDVQEQTCQYNLVPTSKPYLQLFIVQDQFAFFIFYNEIYWKRHVHHSQKNLAQS